MKKYIWRMPLLALLFIVVTILTGVLLSDCDQSMQRYEAHGVMMSYPQLWGKVREDYQNGDKTTLMIDDYEDIDITIKITRSPRGYLSNLIKNSQLGDECEVLSINHHDVIKFSTVEENCICNHYGMENDEKIYEIIIKYKSSIAKKDMIDIEDFISSIDFYDSQNESYTSQIITSKAENKRISDLYFLKSRLPELHINLFSKISEKDFDDMMDGLIASSQDISDDELLVGIMKVLAAVGDPHTLATFDDELYPVRYYVFDDGVYIIDIQKEFHEAIGDRLMEINGVAIDDLMRMYRDLISYENESWFKYKFALKLRSRRIVKGLGISTSGAIEFTLLNKKGNSYKICLPLKGELENNSNDIMLYKKKPDKNYWFEYLEDEKVLYFKYNACMNEANLPFDIFLDDMFKFISHHAVNKLIVDIRNNKGGTSTIFEPFVERIKLNESLNMEGKLYLIVGRETFSSAIINYSELREETNIIVVGEQPGSSFTHFGQIYDLLLSNINVKVYYSTKHFELLRNTSDLPDIIVPNLSSDYFANVDRALEIILAKKE